MPKQEAVRMEPIVNPKDYEKFDRKSAKIEWIKCKDISVIWASAQRPLNKRHVEMIAQNFDPDMFDAVKVTMPNGKGVYHAIDGQHRKAAVELLWGPEEFIPCEILDAEDPARAAELFVEINSGRKALTPLQMFLVRVTAGKETQVAVDKIVRSLGLRVQYGTGNPKYVMAVAAIEAVYRTYGGDILALTLKCLMETWPNDSGAFGAALIRGYAAFLAEFRHHVDFNHLRSTVSNKYSPGNLTAVAKNYKEMHGGGMPEATKALLIVNYNKGKRSGSQIVSKEKTHG